jgi:DNA invertase Pin-like site-specific DNA recombinase
MALAKQRKATLLVAKLDRLSRSVAFIATLMDSKGFDLAIADMPGANRLTLHVLVAAAEHERHMVGERTRQALAAAKVRGIKLGNPEQAEINRAKAAARAQALRPLGITPKAATIWDCMAAVVAAGASPMNFPRTVHWQEAKEQRSAEPRLPLGP